MNNTELKTNKVFIYTVSDFKPGSIECIEMLFSPFLKENDENVELYIIANNRPYKEIDKRIKIIEDNNENGNRWVGFLKFSDKIPHGYGYYVYLDSDILYYGKSSDLFDSNCDFTIVREFWFPMTQEWFFYKKSTQEEFVKMSNLTGINSVTFAYKDINFLEKIRKLYENEIASDALSNGKLEQCSFNYAICKELDFNIDNRVLDLTSKSLLFATGKKFDKEKTIYHFNSLTNTMNPKLDKMKAFLEENKTLIPDSSNIRSISKRNDIGLLMSSLNYTSAIEIGVNRGHFSRIILSKWNGTLYMCDPWRYIDGYIDVANVKDEEFEIIYNEAVRNVSGFSERAKIIRDFSANASELFADESLDLVYIDADHSYSGCYSDIETWFPKVKSGGLICGHDYLDANIPFVGEFGVKSAVKDFFKKDPDFITKDDEPWCSWFIYKDI